MGEGERLAISAYEKSQDGSKDLSQLNPQAKEKEKLTKEKKHWKESLGR